MDKKILEAALCGGTVLSDEELGRTLPGLRLVEKRLAHGKENFIKAKRLTVGQDSTPVP